MLEVWYFIKFLSIMSFSLYLTFFCSMKTKILAFFLYACKKNTRLLHKILDVYMEENSDNDVLQKLSFFPYGILYGFKFMDIVLSWVGKMLLVSYDSIRTISLLQPYVEIVEESMVELDNMYLAEKNKVIAICILYMKETIMGNLCNNKPLNYNASVRATASHKEQHKMKVNLNEKLQKLRKNKKNK